MEITADGVPTAITIRKSSGFARLDQSAQTTVADWRFNPAQHMGAPVSSVLEINIVFRLTDEAAE
jgi:protein TonB